MRNGADFKIPLCLFVLRGDGISFFFSPSVVFESGFTP